jgi:hypothetical protein
MPRHIFKDMQKMVQPMAFIFCVSLTRDANLDGLNQIIYKVCGQF